MLINHKEEDVKQFTVSELTQESILPTDILDVTVAFGDVRIMTQTRVFTFEVVQGRFENSELSQVGIKELPVECYKFIGGDLLSFDSIIKEDGTVVEIDAYIVKILDCSTSGEYKWLLIDSEASSWLYEGHMVSKLDVSLDGQWVSFCDGTLVSFGDHSTRSYRLGSDNITTPISVSDLKIPTVTNLLGSGDNFYLLSKSEQSSI